MVENLNNTFNQDEALEQKKESSFKTFMKKVLKFLKWFKAEFITFPLFIVFHPLKGWEEFKREKRGKFGVAIVFMAFAAFLSIMEYQYSGFIVSQVDVTSLKIFSEIAYIVAPIVLITVSNWSITTLFDGKGKMKEIFMMICYSLFPLVWAKFVGLFVSNVVSQQEQAIYTLIQALGVFFMCYMAFFGFISIHEYGLLKSILSLIGTAVALLVICFIGILGFDLVQKMYGTLYTIYREITLRYF